MSGHFRPPLNRIFLYEPVHCNIVSFCSAVSVHITRLEKQFQRLITCFHVRLTILHNNERFSRLKSIGLGLNGYK